MIEDLGSCAGFGRNEIVIGLDLGSDILIATVEDLYDWFLSPACSRSPSSLDQRAPRKYRDGRRTLGA
jgi:hypothetical protein